MDYETRLETNRSGFWEIRWTETDATGRGRSRSVSTRTKDKRLAQELRRRLTTGGRLEVERVDGVRGSLTRSLPISMAMALARRDLERQWKGKTSGN